MRLEMSQDPEKGGSREIKTVFDTSDRHWQQIVAKSLVRPFKLFFYEPIVQLLGVYMAFVYGLLYRKQNDQLLCHRGADIGSCSLPDDHSVDFRGRIWATSRLCRPQLHRAGRRLDRCLAN